MSKKEKLVTPKLRFSQFRNDPKWEVNKFGKLVIPVEEKAGTKKYTLMSVTSGVGLISQKEKFGREIAGNAYKNYYVIKKNDFAYNKSATKQFPEGYISMLTEYEEAALPNSIFTCFRVVDKESEPKFFDHLFHNNYHGTWLRKYIEVGARAHGSLSVDTKHLWNMPIALPKLHEQQKIADCLSSLDDLIAAEDKKLSALKDHKKGLMQKLFPAEGTTVPEWRFPEFRDSGDWKLTPIGEKVDLLSGYAFKGEEISQNSTGIPLMRGINITEGQIRHNQDIDRFFCGCIDGLQKYLLQKGDLVIGMDGSKVGKNSALITTNDEGSLLIQRVARLRANLGTSMLFMFHHINSNKFHSYVDRINTSSGIPHISAKQIEEFKICFPVDKKEQEKIADCLSELDNLITAHVKKMEALKIHKTGLMQGLFPSIEEVEV